MRRLIQSIFSFLYNGYLYGFVAGGIYQGGLKFVPCPGLNCHSCPGALFACPVGVIQLFASYGKYYISFYTIGFLGFVGALAGRIVCGWACPFGLVQDLMHKIASRKFEIPRMLEHVRYAVLVGVVLIAAYITKEPWFCKIICPAGTLEAGIPLLLLNADLRQMISWVFYVKISLLVLFLGWMVVCKRPFCRVVCPLGTIYGICNRFSIFQPSVDQQKCIRCGTCSSVCPVAHAIHDEKGSATRCIRCYQCRGACPTGAISVSCATTCGRDSQDCGEAL